MQIFDSYLPFVLVIKDLSWFYILYALAEPSLRKNMPREDVPLGHVLGIFSRRFKRLLFLFRQFFCGILAVIFRDDPHDRGKRAFFSFCSLFENLLQTFSYPKTNNNLPLLHHPHKFCLLKQWIVC
jgi:hypothetical protein